MTIRSSQHVALMFSMLAVASCGENSSPTQPDTAPNQAGNPPAFAIAAKGWTAKAKMPTARRELAAAAVSNASGQPVLYAIGGMSAMSAQLTTVEAYNLATNAWSTKASLPVPLGSGINGAGVIAGKIYVTAVSLGASRLYMYDPVSDAWTRKADMPHMISEGITGVVGGKLYVLNGYTDYGCFQDSGFNCGETDPVLYSYDPVSDMWTTLSPCPGQHLAGAGAVINGKFYVAGGEEGERYSRRLHVYDPLSGTWSEKARMSRRRIGMAGVNLLGQFYVMGGSSTPGVPGTRFVEAYDPVADTWTAKPPMLTARSYFGAARMNLNGVSRILVAGGENSHAGALRLAEAYTP